MTTSPRRSATVDDFHAPIVRSVHQRTGAEPPASADPPAGAELPAGAERAVPYFCPYCADEDLHPLADSPGAWQCRTCTRAFRVSFLGLTPRSTTPSPGAPR